MAKSNPKTVAYKAKNNPNPQKPVPTAPYYYDGTQRAEPKQGKFTKTETILFEIKLL